MLHELDLRLAELKAQRLRGAPGKERRVAARALLRSTEKLPQRSFQAAALLELADGWLPDDPAEGASCARLARGLIHEGTSPNLVALSLAIEADALIAGASSSNRENALAAHEAAQRAVVLATRERARMTDPILRATAMRERGRIFEGAVRAALAAGRPECALETAELARPSLDSAPAVLPISAVQAALRSDEAVVAYTWIGPDRLLIAAITDDAFAWVLSAVPPGVTALLDGLASHLRNAGLEGWTISSEEIAALDTLAPSLLPDFVLSALERRRKVLILSHRSLHAVPFGLLPVGGTRLGLRHPIATIPSLGILARRVPIAPRRGLIALGVGTYPGGVLALRSFPPAAAAVAARHAQEGLPALLLPETGARQALLAAAESGELDRSALLLLACHGTSVQGDDPDHSFLQLGPDRLDAATLAAMSIRADLVILYACCSGQRAVGGRDLVFWPGDDLFGLQAAFWRAGARQVIGALWNATEAAAAALAPLVHATWLNGADASEALHSGAVALAQRPLFARKLLWAPFTAAMFGRASSNTG